MLLKKPSFIRWIRTRVKKRRKFTVPRHYLTKRNNELRAPTNVNSRPGFFTRTCHLVTSKFSQWGELASGEIKKYKYVSHVNSRWNSNASTSYKLVLRVCSSEGNRLQSDDSNEPKRMESNCYTIIILAGNREQTKDTNKMEAEL